MNSNEHEGMRDQWLDRLWGELFAEGGGLISPRQIRIDGLDRGRVRAAELATIEATEIELQQLRSGDMLRDVSGQLVDARAAGDVPMFGFIERPPLDDDALFARVSRPDNFLRSASADIEQQDLKYSLNLRRLALLCEAEIYGNSGTAVMRLAPLRPSGQWVQRWRALAQQIFTPELQRLWARVLVQEVAAPGRYPLAVLDVLAHISERDLPGVRLLASYSFREFIYDARGDYFSDESHAPLIRMAANIGLLRADAQRQWLTLKPRRTAVNPQLLICNNRAVQVRQLPEQGARVPVIRVSETGKQIFRLCAPHADMAYLLALAEYLQHQGATVALGDWAPYVRTFDKRLDVA